MLKGKTIIELTDVKTGKVEKFEDNNLVTEAINDIILSRKKYAMFSEQTDTNEYDRRSSFRSMFPLWQGYFGGIMLFQNSIDESRKYLNGDDVILGSATYGNAYAGLDPLIGSYNSTESEMNEGEKYAKFVYDFATNQGNGTISAICLGNHIYNKFSAYGKNYEGDYLTSHLANIINATDTVGGWANNNQTPYKPHYVLFPTGIKLENGIPQSYNVRTSDGNYCYECPIVYDEMKGHLITLEYVNSENKTLSYSVLADTIRLHVYDIGMNNVGLFEKFDRNSYYSRIVPNEVFTKDFTVNQFGSYAYYNLATTNAKQGYYDKSTKCAYLLGDTVDTSLEMWENNAVMTLFKFNLDVENYEDITLETCNITNKSGSKIHITSTHKSQSQNRYYCVKDNYIYAPLYSNGIAKINITDSTDVTVIDGGVHKYPCDIQGDFIYLGCYYKNSSTNTVKVLNTKTNEIKYTRIQVGYYGHCCSTVPFKHSDAYSFYVGGAGYTDTVGETTYSGEPYWYGTICSRNDYLATINNLATPITKTNDKTMKITYILREE